MQTIIDFLSFLPHQIEIFIVSMIPLIELRGAIILAAALKVPWAEAYLVCVLGNILPIPFVIKFAEELLRYFKKTRLLGNFTKKYEAGLLAKAHNKNIRKYSMIGLLIFVAIPLPGTGAWSGAAIAALLDLPVRKSFYMITIGVLIAGIIMTFMAYGAANIFRLAF